MTGSTSIKANSQKQAQADADRMGDSPTNILTPMSPYFALALTYLQQYYKKAGVGTLMSLSLPYSISMIVGWFLFFLAWYYAGIPLGPGAPMTYGG